MNIDPPSSQQLILRSREIPNVVYVIRVRCDSFEVPWFEPTPKNRFPGLARMARQSKRGRKR